MRYGTHSMLSINHYITGLHFPGSALGTIGTHKTRPEHIHGAIALGVHAAAPNQTNQTQHCHSNGCGGHLRGRGRAAMTGCEKAVKSDDRR